ncbi:hypothetical protein SUGI_0522790 [Cryptomeria japonica]|nr:hypothetical protein SUGI_0522790 [Cryptomeria japonica]
MKPGCSKVWENSFPDLISFEEQSPNDIMNPKIMGTKDKAQQADEGTQQANEGSQSILRMEENGRLPTEQCIHNIDKTNQGPRKKVKANKKPSQPVKRKKGIKISRKSNKRSKTEKISMSEELKLIELLEKTDVLREDIVQELQIALSGDPHQTSVINHDNVIVHQLVNERTQEDQWIEGKAQDDDALHESNQMNQDDSKGNSLLQIEAINNILGISNGCPEENDTFPHGNLHFNEVESAFGGEMVEAIAHGSQERVEYFMAAQRTGSELETKDNTKDAIEEPIHSAQKMKRLMKYYDFCMLKSIKA